jgi:regulator of sigma E protease
MAFLQQIWAFSGYVVPFVFVLSLVVFFHELGHFLVGRWCGVQVDAFSLGFGPELFHYTDRRGTRWRFALLPLGGYVKFHGDANGASMSLGEQEVAMSADERKVSFFTQAVWKRMAIVAAGPIANFLLAIVIFTCVTMVYGRGMLVPRIEGLRAGEVAEQAGFKPGDLIVSVDGQPIDSWSDMQRIVQVSAEIPLKFIVSRDGADVAITVTPQLRVIKGAFGSTRIGLIGLLASSNPNDWRIQKFGPLDSLRFGVEETGFVVSRTFGYIGGLFVGKESLENMDGGHLLYYCIEALKGRPLSGRAQEFGFRVGLAFVAALMLFATFNDIMHIVKI